jgi:hypothetical protein
LLTVGAEDKVTSAEASDLRYLDAHSVRCAAGTLSDFRVCTEDAEPLGQVGGVLISPSSRQLRYFVIDRPGLFSRRRLLLPAEAGAVVEGDERRLMISARRDELDLTTYQPRSVPEFSDDDLITTLFPVESGAR